MEKNVEENEEIFKLANSLGEYKRDILDLFAKGPDAKSEEELLYQAEEKVKDSVVILKKIFKSHENYKFEGLKKKELKERSLMAESFGYILNIASIFGYPISSEMFRNAIRTDIPIVLFNEELQEKVNDSLNADSEFISLVNEVKKKIVDEINKLEPTNGLVDFKKESGGFIYREIDEDSDTIYCRIPIKSFGNKDLQYSIGKVDAYIKYEKDENGIWKGSLVMDDLYDFPEGNFKSTKGILNKIGHSFQEKGKIMPYRWRFSFKMPDITEKDIKINYSAVA